MSESYVQVSIAVPFEALSAFHRAVADVLSDYALAEREGDTAQEYAVGLDREAIEDAYSGGDSRVQRPLLDYLAGHAGEWVPSDGVMEAIDREPAQYRGAMGAFERRVGADRLPYEKDWRQGKRWYRMPEEVAEIVNEIREKG